MQAVLNELTQAEQCAVVSHREVLCRDWGRSVPLDEARENWLRYHADDWRADRMRKMLAMQRDEINRYKWIESEKAQRDLGREAVFDWINKYAAQWRDWFEQEFVEQTP
jgi:hypothetical protein